MMLHRLIERYLAAVETALEQMDLVRVDRYVEEVLTPKRLNLRIRLRFENGILLEINEAIQVESETLVWVDYRYHLQDAQNRLIFRYDNTPHFPSLPTFPHHKHLPNQVITSAKPSLIEVLQESQIEQ